MTIEAGLSRGRAHPLEDRQAQAVFASVIETFRVVDHARLNREILNVISQTRPQDEGISRSNRGGWHSSKTLFTRDEPPMREICRHIRLALLTATRRYLPDFDPSSQPALVEGWINASGKGAYNAPHTHDGCHLSGVYYVSIPDGAAGASSMLQFFTPLGATNPLGKLGRAMAPAQHSIRPDEGLLVVFPSYLRHWVPPNEDEGERVSLAFNFTVPDAR